MMKAEECVGLRNRGSAKASARPYRRATGTKF